MKTYHLHAKCITRSKNSAAAALAYRVGMKFADPHDQKMKYPHRRQEEILSHFLINWDNPLRRSEGSQEIYQQILDEIGRTETRCNSRLWREFEFALPIEGTDEDRAKITEAFARMLATIYGISLIMGIHKPPNPETKNHHAHALALTRFVVRADGRIYLGKKNRALDAWGMVKKVRKLWEVFLNGYYKRLGIDKVVSCESYATRNIGQIPTIHEGPNARRNGGERHEINKVIRRLNKQAPKTATSPAEVFDMIPLVIDKLEKKVTEATLEIKKITKVIQSKLDAPLSPRQKKQLAKVQEIVSETIGSEATTHSPTEISTTLKASLQRGGFAGGPFDRLRKSLPPTSANIEARQAREGIDLLALLFAAPDDVTLKKLKRWITGDLEVQSPVLANLEDPIWLQHIHDWQNARDFPDEPDVNENKQWTPP